MGLGRNLFRHAPIGVAALAMGCHTVTPQPVPSSTEVVEKFTGDVIPVEATQPAEDGGAATHTIDLEVALRLAGADNPTINLAREAIREAQAGHLAARSLLLPNLNAGGSFRYHNGPILAVSGVLEHVELRSLYLGAGAYAVGAGTVMIPGVRLVTNLSDAAYAPLAARQRISVRRSEAGAVRNAILLDVAIAYYELVGAEARLAGFRLGEVELGEVVRLTASYAKAGEGKPSDAMRADANVELLRRDIGRAEEDIGVAAARLARLLNLDPAVSLRGPGGDLHPVCLVPEASDPETLIAEAERARPEMAARSAALAEARTLARQERVRPWLPTLSVGYSYAGFGGGSDRTADPFGSLHSRSDFDAAAVWTFQNLGVGNRARVRTADAVVGGVAAEIRRMKNQVQEEVATALADAQAAATQSETAQAALETAKEGFELEVERIRKGQGRPIEVLDSFRQHLDSQQELLRATVAYNIAQFRLFVALGHTP